MSLLNLQILLSPPPPPPPPPPPLLPFHSLKFILFHPSSSLLATKTLKPLALAPLIRLRSAGVRVFVQNNGLVKEEEEEEDEVDDLGEEGDVFRKTLRLVECSMFASVAGLAYFLSNSLAIEVREIFEWIVRNDSQYLILRSRKSEEEENAKRQFSI